MLAFEEHSFREIMARAGNLLRSKKDLSSTGDRFNTWPGGKGQNVSIFIGWQYSPGLSCWMGLSFIFSYVTGSEILSIWRNKEILENIFNHEVPSEACHQVETVRDCLLCLCTGQDTGLMALYKWERQLHNWLNICEQFVRRCFGGSRAWWIQSLGMLNA